MSTEPSKIPAIPIERLDLLAKLASTDLTTAEISMQMGLSEVDVKAAMKEKSFIELRDFYRAAFIDRIEHKSLKELESQLNDEDAGARQKAATSILSHVSRFNAEKKGADTGGPGAINIVINTITSDDLVEVSVADGKDDKRRVLPETAGSL